VVVRGEAKHTLKQRSKPPERCREFLPESAGRDFVWPPRIAGGHWNGTPATPETWALRGRGPAGRSTPPLLRRTNNLRPGRRNGTPRARQAICVEGAGCQLASQGTGRKAVYPAATRNNNNQSMERDSRQEASDPRSGWWVPGKPENRKRETEARSSLETWKPNEGNRSEKIERGGNPAIGWVLCRRGVASCAAEKDHVGWTARGPVNPAEIDRKGHRPTLRHATQDGPRQRTDRNPRQPAATQGARAGARV
jgi:hypothetical protein